MVDPTQAGVTPTCPACEAALTVRAEALHCPACEETVPVVDGIARFPVSVEQSAVPPVFDALASIYETPLWFPVVYRVIGGPHAPIDDRARIVDALDVTGGDVLDVACGTGRLTRVLAADAAAVWGIDVSMGMVRRARRDGRHNVVLAQMDAEDLRFEDGAFEGVACGWALHLFADIPTTVAEIHRVLAPDGRFAGTTLSADSLLALPAAQYGLAETIGAHVFDHEELRELLLETGFRTVQFERYGAALFFRATK
ncbi:class I SAM-dependent methyltransferase [Natronococcus occultus]|uniref:Methylase involved in ubiquinone/menaquinone biosynthesis n=1 Tax=Natronococcus occultus SP4 TaxID=694430 RepID=L0K1J0_9EURY|nr:class I SAM-dependent methyltransferase [Natronococcus occultus]AGB38841.1 methylase involved in ubiquinone/menaquinone biosynthesis [Natronococcus occultus SP4]